MSGCSRLLIAVATACRLSAWAAPQVPYAIVATGQTKCYDNRGEIQPPKPGQPFYGQDAQFPGCRASYTLSADGLTVRDNVTGLTWQRSPDTDGDGKVTWRDKVTFAQAQALPAKLNATRFAGFNDWRLPSIKELYSLFDASGVDPSSPSRDGEAAGLRPFLDTNFFRFAYGDLAAGERIIDSQYASSTKYVGKGPRGVEKVFGVNFADGRIKGYDLFMPGGGEKTFFVLCVRGNPSYGKNDFHENGDGTITDRATGLMWAKTDSGRGLNWQEALAWVQEQNARKYLGYDDWRLPNIKELQSIVDYSRSPDTTGSPAIAPLFMCTAITNEVGQLDWPYYWSSTTHVGLRGGWAAMYVAFGRAAGWMILRPMAGAGPDRRDASGPPARNPRPSVPPEAYRFVDVHGAGAQRSDPKAGDPGLFPYGRGPQGDVVRIYNFARLVRGGAARPRAQAGPAPR